MKNSLAVISVCGALVLSCATSSGAVFTDVNDYTDQVLVLGINRPLQSFTDSFNIADRGYTPGDHISYAIARFVVRDENRNEPEFESFDVYLGAEYFTTGGPSNFPFGSNTIGLTVGGNLWATLLLDLEQDGILTYTVTATQGDFRFKEASLQATVPDGGMTVGILGLGLLGVGAFRRLTSRKCIKCLSSRR